MTTLTTRRTLGISILLALLQGSHGSAEGTPPLSPGDFAPLPDAGRIQPRARLALETQHLSHGPAAMA